LTANLWFFWMLVLRSSDTITILMYNSPYNNPREYFYMFHLIILIGQIELNNHMVNLKLPIVCFPHITWLICTWVAQHLATPYLLEQMI
jgi:hypothetical protein